MVFLVFMYPVLTGQDGVCTFMATGAFFCLLHMRKDYYLIFERRIYMDFLFSPYTLPNGVEIKNRLVVAPMTHWGADVHTGVITDAERNFLKGRAEGFGMFILAATLVARGGKSFAGEPHAICETDLPSLKERARIIHAQGAKAVLQIHHGGYTALNDLLDGMDKIAPSDARDMTIPEQAPQGNKAGTRAATEEEIEGLIHAFAHAASLAIEAGFDGVEIHGANGYLLQQFYSGASNRRTDKWGGTREKRMRFPLAVLDAVLEARKESGRNDFIVGYRFSPEEPWDDGLTMEDTLALIDELKKRNLDYLHVSLHDFFAMARRGGKPGVERIRQIHERIDGTVPLIGVGGLVTGEKIEQAATSGWAEFIAVGKAVMANKNLAILLKEGRLDQIRTEIDPNNKEYYGFPAYLWELEEEGLAFLPPLKKGKKN